MNCIGLFGTCGNSKWRDDFISDFDERNIKFFNPLVKNWKPEDAVIEAEHLANDNIVLFPITSETYGVGSLSEVGFGILNAIKLDDRRDFIIMIDSHLNKELLPIDGWEDIDASSNAYEIEKEVFERAKESLRARALVMQHLKKLRLKNIFLVENLFDMANVARVLYRSNSIREQVDRNLIHKD